MHLCLLIFLPVPSISSHGHKTLARLPVSLGAGEVGQRGPLGAGRRALLHIAHHGGGGFYSLTTLQTEWHEKPGPVSLTGVVITSLRVTVACPSLWTARPLGQMGVCVVCVL